MGNYIFAGPDFRKREQIKSVDIGYEPLNRGLKCFVVSNRTLFFSG